jgi:hypothetical protein
MCCVQVRSTLARAAAAAGAGLLELNFELEDLQVSSVTLLYTVVLTLLL